MRGGPRLNQDQELELETTGGATQAGGTNRTNSTGSVEYRKGVSALAD